MFCVGVAASAFAPNFEMLMVGRIVQACGNGVIGSLAQVVLLTIFPTNKRGKVMGWYGLSLSAAPANKRETPPKTLQRRRFASSAFW